MRKCMIVGLGFLLGLGAAWAGEGPVAARTTEPAPASLKILVAARQPADAPVVLQAKLTNTSDRVIQGYFDQNISLRAYLTGPDGKTKAVAVTNGSRIRGSFLETKALAPGESTATWLRLTTYHAQDWRDYLPSEDVFLKPGEYRLRLERLFEGSGGEAPVAESTAAFTVASDAALAKARWAELKNPPKGMEAFAKHVLEATLTPDLRREWYRDILDADPEKGAWKVYTLSVIDDPPPDVAPAITAALKVQVDNPQPASREQAFLLNNAAYFLLNHHPLGAGDALLKLATSRYECTADQNGKDTLSSARTAAIDALRYYWRDELADRIAPLLQSPDKWTPVYAARLLAWAGDDRGVAWLIAGVEAREAFAAGGLAYLPDNPAAAEALKKALADDNQEFSKRLRQVLDEQVPARNQKPPKAQAPPAFPPSRQPAKQASDGAPK